MIVLDIETSGLDFVKCGIWQVGAVDLITGEEFLEEAKLDDNEQILDSNSPNDKPVLEVIGKTEKELRDLKKQTQKELLMNFFKWIETKKIKNFICQNPQFDVSFILTKARKYNLKVPFHHRCFDTHSIAQTKFYELNKKFLIGKEHSQMNLAKVLELCGIEDNRKVHNALEDAKLTAECFSRLVYGKRLFSEFDKFEVPDYLK